MSEKSMPERDINDIFDDIVLTEERLAQQGYEEGHAEGRAEGSREGYQLGYTQGVLLGQELGEIIGAVTAQQELEHTDKVLRALQHLRDLIEEFPRENYSEADILGALENIRTLNKRTRVMLGLRAAEKDANQSERKDLSF